MFEFVQINKSLNVIFNFILQEVHFIKYSADRLSRQTEYMHWLLQHSFQIMYIRVFQMWHFVKKKIAMPVQFPPGHI